MSSVKTYRVFGLTLRSEIEIEYLDEITTDDVDVEVKRVVGIVRDQHEYDPEFDIKPDEQYFHWQAIGAYKIVDDNTILVQPHYGIADLLASHALMGLVMSVMLERRGLLCLHASGVNVNGTAAVFLGDKGAGKSTTTGAMLAQGHVPISDDLIALDFSLTPCHPPMIHPGFSSTKLYPDSIAALGLRDDPSDRKIHHTTIKKQKQMSVPVEAEPVALGALFVLQRSQETSEVYFQRQPPQSALQAVMRYAFKARYGETKMGRESLVRHMKMCSAVVAKTPVYNLFLPQDLDRLAEIPPTIAYALKS